MKFLHKKIFIASAIAAAFFVATPALAAFVPPECTGTADPASCGLQSLVNVFIRFANYLFGIAGSVAFIFFIYGGYTLLASGGSAEKIQKGKTIVINAVIGLFLVFGARGLVTLVLQAVTKGSKVLIEGASCQPLAKLPSGSVIKPRAVKNAEGALVCIASCEEYAQTTGKKYECTEPAGLSDCVSNLCEGKKEVSKCCVKQEKLKEGSECVCSSSAGEFTLVAAGAVPCGEIKCSVTPDKKTCLCKTSKAAVSSMEYNESLGQELPEFESQCNSISNCRPK